MAERIVYKMGLLKLAEQEKWSTSYDAKLQEYVNGFMEKGALKELMKFVQSGLKGRPQTSRIRKYIKEISGDGHPK